MFEVFQLSMSKCYGEFLMGFYRYYTGTIEYLYATDCQFLQFSYRFSAEHSVVTIIIVN